ncbi:hypothetical protein [Kineococcus rubinsiae]|uniref:hypothetical protein n=1 Tax=Kineococcus rubinsiae TaxID=2609562 RepID=UPI0014317B5E|nr:hypothetical protein [Kineococcus rubinsiae]NIZ90339.1 hypothetical protein [Kineococcus rubinsiae]
MDHRKVPNGWAAWFLVLAAALPIVVIICFGGKVLTGAADEVFGLQDRALTGLDLLGSRWSSLWLIQPVLILPLVGLLPLIVLAALVVADRPQALVPVSVGRGAAALVAAITSLLGLAASVAVIAQLLGLLPGLGWGSVTGSQMEAYAPVAAIVFTTSVLGIAATAVLWPRRHGQHDDEAGVVEGVTEDGFTEDEAGADGAMEQTMSEAVVARPVVHPPVALPDLPVPSVKDLDLYRRQ